ncbi:hypothetical protein Tco_0869555 [Tanacetum coccineum]
MSSTTTQQTKLDLELVPKEKRFDISFLDALALAHATLHLLITGDVRSLHASILDSVSRMTTFYRLQDGHKEEDSNSIWMSSKGHLQICPRVLGLDTLMHSYDRRMVFFFSDLVHREIYSLNDVVVDQMHQPSRNYAALINRSLSRKTTGLDKLRLSRAQIIWGMYHQKNVDYVELLWEDFIYQIDNKAYKNQENMYYPLFTKVIIHYFLTQDKTHSWRNKIGMHTSKDDYLINTQRFVSAKEET